MHVDRPRRNASRGIRVLLIAVLAAASLGAGMLTSAGATQSPALGGRWSGSYSGTFNGTFTLKWTQTGSNLRGTITLSQPSGTYGITGSVNGTGIKFGAVGVGAVYTGSVAASGRSMSGDWASGPAKGTWNAHKLLTPTKTKHKKP